MGKIGQQETTKKCRWCTSSLSCILLVWVGWSASCKLCNIFVFFLPMQHICVFFACSMVMQDAVYPMKYAHIFVVVIFFLLADADDFFTHDIQGYFSGTGKIGTRYVIEIHSWSLRVRLSTSSIVSYNGLVLNRCQAIVWTNDGDVHWRICVSLGLDVSRHCLNWLRLSDEYMHR